MNLDKLSPKSVPMDLIKKRSTLLQVFGLLQNERQAITEQIWPPSLRHICVIWFTYVTNSFSGVWLWDRYAGRSMKHFEWMAICTTTVMARGVVDVTRETTQFKLYNSILFSSSYSFTMCSFLWIYFQSGAMLVQLLRDRLVTFGYFKNIRYKSKFFVKQAFNTLLKHIKAPFCNNKSCEILGAANPWIDGLTNHFLALLVQYSVTSYTKSSLLWITKQRLPCIKQVSECSAGCLYTASTTGNLWRK